ncbi:MAG: hypothetical protein R2910_05985 [Gemmatimonadales bacterium]
MDEYKYTFTTEIQNAIVQKGNVGGSQGPSRKQADGAVMTTCTNPQEDVSIGIRHIPTDDAAGRGGARLHEDPAVVPAPVQTFFASNKSPRVRRDPGD